MRNYLLLICLVYSLNLLATVREFPVKLSLSTMFDSHTSYETGIKGSVNSGGKIDIKLIDKNTGTLLFQCTLNKTSTEFAGGGQSYAKESLGSGATYYPASWNSLDLKTALFAIDRKHYDQQTIKPYSFLSSDLELTLKIEEVNAQMQFFKFPGVGIIDQYGGNSLFHPKHFCYNLANASSFVTKAWTKVKTPDMNAGSDLVIAAHRGVWGDNLGAGVPENSIAAIKDTKKYTDVLESDIMITKDKQLIVSHDYSLMRLTDSSGSPRDYLFNMNLSQLKDLHLRKRDMTVTDFKYLTFDDMVDALIKYQLVLTVDIKEIIARRKNGVCIDNCEYDPKTHGEEAKKKIKDSWMEIMKKCIEIAASKNALQYLAFKLPHEYTDLLNYVSNDTLSQVLFMPVIQPTRKDYLDFIDSWIANGGSRVLAYQTNFRIAGDKYLSAFTRNGVEYTNLLHYVYAKTGLRPGNYPEEPMGPKGIVNRWADWMIKDLRVDWRGDYYFFMSIPYGKIIVLTTDRPDMWIKIDQMYKTKTP